MKIVGKHKGIVWHPQGYSLEHEIYNRDLWITVANVKLMTTTHDLLYRIYDTNADHPVASVFVIQNPHIAAIRHASMETKQ